MMNPDDPLARFRHTQCLSCGYDMRGAIGDTRCPECGLVFHPGLIIGNRLTHTGRWFVTIVYVLCLVAMVYTRIGAATQITSQDLIFITIFGGLLLYVLWRAWRPGPSPIWGATVCTAHGWTQDSFPVDPDHEFRYSPWTQFVRVEVRARGFVMRYLRARSYWTLGFHFKPGKQDRRYRYIMRRRIGGPPIYEVIVFKATTEEAKAIRSQLAAYVEAAQREPGSDEEAGNA
jgi:hypothetical protein